MVGFEQRAVGKGLQEQGWHHGRKGILQEEEQHTHTHTHTPPSSLPSVSTGPFWCLCLALPISGKFQRVEV
jgi:hypothetical protein